MIRILLAFGAVAVVVVGILPPVYAQSDETGAATSGSKRLPVRTRVAAKPKADPKQTAADDKAAPSAKPLLVGTYGDWGAYQTQTGKGRICYALAKPKERQPANLVRDPAYVFIATRPAESVRNEISVIMGFPLKEGTIVAGADIDGTKFDLVAKGEDAWVKNAAEEGQVIDAMRKGARLVVKAPSKKGNITTDGYSLVGLSQALDKVAKNCP